MIRLLAVDDSALMRRCVRAIFEDEGDFVVETARNGADAIEKARSFTPHVMTLDINMPELDGLGCLDALMAERPLPVVMLSSLTAEGAAVTLDALRRGAVDFVEKPGGTVSLNIDEIRPLMVAKVRAAARARVSRPPRHAAAPAPKARESARGPAARKAPLRPARIAPTRSADPLPGIVLIGVSTGGPQTLEEILPCLPGHLAWPIVIAQHMPASFTGVFAQRVDRLCTLDVVEVERPMPLAGRTVYIARGGGDIEIQMRLGRLTAVPVPTDEALVYHPNVDRLVHSALAVMPAARLVSVLLTGMGRDGAEAMKLLHQGGGRTIAETEESAVVFGMPAALIANGGASMTLPSHEIAGQLARWLC